RAQELVRVPARRQWSRLGFPVADNAADEEAGVVECGADSVCERIPQLAALVDRAGRLRSNVARDTARKRELPEERAETLLVPGNVRVDLAVRSLEIRVRNETRAAVPGPGDVDRAQIALADRPVEMDVDEVQTGRRAE